LINNRQNGRRRGRGGGSGAPRPNGSNGGQDRGNRIDNRARGNAAQLHEKYKTLARDAQMQGDRVNTEYYLQFADHYFRVLSESRARFDEQQPRPRRDEYTAQPDEDYGDEGERIGSDDARPPEPIFAMREAEPQRDYGGREAPDGNPAEARADNRGEEERRPRRGRPPRAAQSYAPVEADMVPQAPVQAEVPVPAEPEERPVRRRGRPPKVQPPEQIDVDRLPPSFSLKAPASQAAADGDKPRPRTRRPRGEAATA